MCGKIILKRNKTRLALKKSGDGIMLAVMVLSQTERNMQHPLHPCLSMGILVIMTWGDQYIPCKLLNTDQLDYTKYLALLQLSVPKTVLFN